MITAQCIKDRFNLPLKPHDVINRCLPLARYRDRGHPGRCRVRAATR